MQQHTVVTNDLVDGTKQKWVQLAARVFPELSTVSKAKRARKSENLLLNGQLRVPTLTCAVVNDVLVYFSSEKQTNAGEDEYVEGHKWLQICKTQGLRLVYECTRLAVVVKPVGIHVKGRGQRTVERALPLLLKQDQVSSVDVNDYKLPIPHAVHRLNYRVGGLLLVAKTRRMEVALSAQFERHSVTKQYRAILVGNVYETIRRLKKGTCGIEGLELPCVYKIFVMNWTS